MASQYIMRLFLKNKSKLYIDIIFTSPFLTHVRAHYNFSLISFHISSLSLTLPFGGAPDWCIGIVSCLFNSIHAQRPSQASSLYKRKFEQANYVPIPLSIVNIISSVSINKLHGSIEMRYFISHRDFHEAIPSCSYFFLINWYGT